MCIRDSLLTNRDALLGALDGYEAELAVLRLSLIHI